MSDKDNNITQEKVVGTSERVIKEKRRAFSNEVEAYEITPAEGQPISTKAKDTGRSLKELVSAVSRKAQAVTEEQTRKIKAHSVDLSSTSDARDINNLGPYMNQLSTMFEDAVTEIRREPYGSQAKLLASYKKLLEEQINVVEARLSLARRLKPGS